MYDLNASDGQWNRSETMSCHSGWKFYHEDPAATSVVQDVSSQLFRWKLTVNYSEYADRISPCFLLNLFPVAAGL